MTAAASHNATAFGLAAARVAGMALDRKTRMRLGRGDSPRTGQPVWRNSYTEGQVERRIWRRIGNGSKRDGARFTGALMAAARRAELESRARRREVEPGTVNGQLGAIGLEVLQVLVDLVDYATGKLEPAIATIAERIGRSYSAVHQALQRLRFAGFVDWIRRSKPVDNPGDAGPQVQQITNAYVLKVPPQLQAWWERKLGRGPIPACEEDRIARDKADFDRMLQRLTSREFAEEFFARDPLLGPTVASLAEALDRMHERESDGRRETGGSVPDPG